MHADDVEEGKPKGSKNERRGRPRRARSAALGLLGGLAAAVSCTARGSGSSGAPIADPLPVTAPDAGEEATPQPAAFHCFTWVHGPDFSTDCYRSAGACERERAAMKKGGGDTADVCHPAARASCVRLRRPPPRVEPARCFAGAGACERYRAYVQPTGHVVTACAEE